MLQAFPVGYVLNRADVKIGIRGARRIMVNKQHERNNEVAGERSGN